MISVEDDIARIDAWLNTYVEKRKRIDPDDIEARQAYDARIDYYLDCRLYWMRRRA